MKLGVRQAIFSISLMGLLMLGYVFLYSPSISGNAVGAHCTTDSCSQTSGKMGFGEQKETINLSVLFFSVLALGVFIEK